MMSVPTAAGAKALASLTDSLSGHKVRAGHRATLFGVLGKDRMIPIRSGGRQFYMVGHFPYRKVIDEIARWSQTNRQAPTFRTYELWATVLNRSGQAVRPSIQIAHTGDVISRRTYMALIGGAYHEGFHRRYSAQGVVSGRDLESAIAPHYDTSVPYHSFKSLLSNIQNVFEDVRIERIGCAEFPGVYTKMADLADFILDQEADTRAKNEKEGASSAQIALAILREVGLGYTTTKTSEALAHYRKMCPEIADMFRSGPFATFLTEAIPDVSTPNKIEQAKLQGGTSLSLSLRFLNLLFKPSEQSPSRKKSKSQGDGEGSGSGSGESSGGSGGGDGAQDFPPERSQAEAEEKDSPEEDSPPPEYGDTAEDILESEDSELKDYSSALQEALEEVRKEDDADLLGGEKPYRPYTTEHDKIVPVTGDEAEGRRHLKYLVAHTKKETAFLSSRLRNLFRALETGDRIHGAHRGSRLSDRYLVDTFASIRAGRDPMRGFVEETEVIDTSIAAYVLLDESFSMQPKLANTSKILYTLGTGLESINARFAVMGFQNQFVPGISDEDDEGEDEKTYLRGAGEAIQHDLFKGFEERFRDVSWKISKLVASGGTPMADGIELGLQTLSTRREGHRVLFVLTDGEPDPSHRPVVKAQLRRAEEAGIHLIGVGLGIGSESVTKLFPDHVYGRLLEELPKKLLQKLEELVSRIGTSKRGSRIRD